MGRLAGKVALVVGGGSGIGRASALAFGREAARVAIGDLNSGLAHEAAELTGGDALPLAMDVTREETVAEAVATVMNRFGRIDMLVNCAGGSARGDTNVAEVDMALWQPTMDVDVRGTLLTCRHVIPHMVHQGGGSIVNMSSWAGLNGTAPKHIYVAAKGAVISLTRAIAGEYARAGIRANVICCGPVRTERSQSNAAKNLAADPNSPLERKRKMLAEAYPFSIGDPDDVANIVLFLASDESRMITAAAIPADGGRSAF
ncbi:MAG TPA: SDR family oxidoreductase [Stellaceae bacterium]|jgi:NAD(P)-dependent dehydrogenase (short-subunit alcohol dehydrogenase family)|nr:SDR family oxidoreductase [Stellaceae bacterium]